VKEEKIKNGDWGGMSTTAGVDLVGVGLNATDTIIPVEVYPERGAKVTFRSANVLPGGQVASAVAACATWGLRTRYVGKVGEDAAGDLHRDEFYRLGVEAHLLTAEGAPSQQAFILVDDKGERTVLWKRDERVALRPEELKREWVTDARVLHVDGHDTAAAATAAGWAKEAGVPVVADLDDLYPGVEQLLPRLDYFVASRDIPERLTGQKDLRKALPEVWKRYGFTLAAATLGEEGVLAWDGERFWYAAAYRVSVVDSIGAGDIFHAGFIYGLMQGWEMQRMLDFGCAAAALNCMAVGARGGIRTVAEIEGLMGNGTRYRAAVGG
jgi:sulfofructose kinase